VGSLVHADAQAVDELTPEPAGDQRQQQSGTGEA
jgi:hypothetical protein